VGLDAVGEILDTFGPPKRGYRLPADHAQQALDPFVAEILELGGVGIERNRRINRRVVVIYQGR
jgi:hypothetical protein